MQNANLHLEQKHSKTVTLYEVTKNITEWTNIITGGVLLLKATSLMNKLADKDIKASKNNQAVVFVMLSLISIFVSFSLQSITTESKDKEMMIKTPIIVIGILNIVLMGAMEFEKFTYHTLLEKNKNQEDTIFFGKLSKFIVFVLGLLPFIYICYMVVCSVKGTKSYNIESLVSEAIVAILLVIAVCMMLYKMDISKTQWFRQNRR